MADSSIDPQGGTMAKPTTVHSVQPKPSGWKLPKELKPIVFDACPEGVATVWLTQTALARISLLHNNTKGEWLAYLSGYRTARGEPVVTELRVPPQIATAASVDVKEWVPADDHLGVMHSHHTMNCSFSGTDHEYINQNHLLSMLVNTDSKQEVGFRVEAELRVPVSCGRQLRQHPTVRIWTPPPTDAEDWLTQSLGNIQKPEPVVHQLGWGQQRGGAIQQTVTADAAKLYQVFQAFGFPRWQVDKMARENQMSPLALMQHLMERDDDTLLGAGYSDDDDFFPYGSR